jgi:hypothetical protein
MSLIAAGSISLDSTFKELLNVSDLKMSISIESAEKVRLSLYFKSHIFRNLH